MAADFEEVYQIDVSLDGSDYTIAADGEGDDGRIWKYQGEEVEIEDLRSALESLRADSADSFTVDGPAGKEEIGLTVYLDNETYPKVELTLCRYDGSNCLAKVNGQIFALISRADVVDLIESVNAIVLN